MIRKLTVLSAIAGLLLVSSALIAAQQAEENPHHFTGIVLAVDAARGLLTVEEASAEASQMAFDVNDATELMKNGESIALDTIEVGDPVSVGYAMTPEGNEGRSVQIITSPESTE